MFMFLYNSHIHSEVDLLMNTPRFASPFLSHNLKFNQKFIQSIHFVIFIIFIFGRRVQSTIIKWIFYMLKTL